MFPSSLFQYNDNNFSLVTNKCDKMLNDMCPNCAAPVPTLDKEPTLVICCSLAAWPMLVSVSEQLLSGLALHFITS